MLSNKERLTVFDQILVGHCFVDGVTGIVDIPLYHVYHTFGYWPIGRHYLAYFWVCFDNSINFITSMHMLYASFARLRSIECSITEYKKHFLIAKPALTCIGIWLIGLTIWIPTVFSFGIIEYTLEVNYNPYYFISIINFITWLLPLALILYYSIKIVIVLCKNDRKRFEIRSITNNVHLAIIPVNETTEVDSIESSISIKIFNNKFTRKLCSIMIALKYFAIRPQGKFTLIMGSYWFQWTPPCLITVFGPLINNMPVSIISHIYWLTYTPCITDPLSVILYNRKVKMTTTTSAV